MKTSLLILLFFISFIGFSQNNYIVKTEDGRRVLLKADYTWEYIDAEKPISETKELVADANIVKADSKAVKIPECSIAQDFVEPTLDKNIQMQLKKGRATIDDIKKKVAKEYKCDVEDVILLSASEEKAKGAYDFCANGTKVSYKRNGHTIVKKGQFI